MATYFEAIVFFEKVAYIRDEKTSPPLRDHLSLHDHLSLFDSDNPLENIRNEIALSPIDARFQVLCKFAEEQLFKLRGYRGLFRTSDGYRVYAEKEIWPDLSFPIVLTYWVSKTLDYTFYADPFESLIASFDAVNSNVEQSSHASEAKSLALLVATSIIKNKDRTI